MSIEIEDVLLYGGIGAVVYLVFFSTPTSSTPPTNPPVGSGSGGSGSGSDSGQKVTGGYLGLPQAQETPSQAKQDLQTLLATLPSATPTQFMQSQQGIPVTIGGVDYTVVNFAVQPTSTPMIGFGLLSQDPTNQTRQQFLALRSAAMAG